jgi:hypothetical protein
MIHPGRQSLRGMRQLHFKKKGFAEAGVEDPKVLPFNL